MRRFSRYLAAGFLSCTLLFAASCDLFEQLTGADVLAEMERDNVYDPDGTAADPIDTIDNDGDGVGDYVDADEIAMLSPSNGAIIGDITPSLSVKEKSAEVVQAYCFKVSGSEDMTSPLVEVDTVDSPLYSVEKDVLTNGATYYWQGGVKDGEGTAHYGGVWSFKIDVSVGTTDDVSPPDNGTVTTTTPLLDWAEVDGAEKYWVQLSDSSTFTDSVEEDDAIEAATSQYQVQTTLTQGSTYYWRVRTYSSETWGDWSSTWNFTVPEPGISITLETDIGDNTPTTDGGEAIVYYGFDMTVTANSSTDVDSYRWYLDGSSIRGETADTITIGSSLSLGSYTLSVVVVKGGTAYSKSLGFRVALPSLADSATTGTGGVGFDLIYVPPGEYYVGSQTGSYDYAANANQTLTKGYWIAETEVTYELWHEVYSWATANGYTFANAGREGNDGSTGAAPTTAKLEPVTYINWRDAMVWCNAISEKMGHDPVYYTDSSFSNPIRTVTNTGTLDTTAGHEDNPYVDWAASGYRLPREVEWEIAARGAGPSTDSYGTTYAGSDTVGDVAWYSSNSNGKTHSVAQKQANEIGLYDMSGNVFEWCWDWYDGSYPAESSDCDGPDAGSYRMQRGGSWNDSVSFCEVVDRDNFYPYFEYFSYGFRPVRTAQGP